MAFSEKIIETRQKALALCKEYFARPDEIAEFNTLKILDAMRKVKVSEAHFNTTSGYAYDDIGRNKIEELYAEVFKAEAALVRTQFVSGTHALATVLFGILRPGDQLIYITGTPYDTMQTVIGYATDSPGSLKEFGILYDEVPLKDGRVDFDVAKEKITTKTKMVVIQRSCGYMMRPSLSVDEIGEICKFVKEINPNCICYVDNCYGEFTDTKEPIEVGADIIAGSLIKIQVAVLHQQVDIL